MIRLAEIINVIPALFLEQTYRNLCVQTSSEWLSCVLMEAILLCLLTNHIKIKIFYVIVYAWCTWLIFFNEVRKEAWYLYLYCLRDIMKLHAFVYYNIQHLYYISIYLSVCVFIDRYNIYTCKFFYVTFSTLLMLWH